MTRRLCAIVTLYLVWVVSLFALAIAIPVQTQITIPLVSTYDTPKPTYELKKSSNRSVWDETFNIETIFNVPSGKLIGYHVVSSLEFYVDAASDDWRNTTVTYTFLCNDEEVRVIVEHIDGTDLRYGGSYPEELIDSEALKIGENKLIVNVTITSQSAVAESSSFILKIEQVKISVKGIDFDGDGILDALDPLLGVNNYHVTPIVAVLSLPLFAAIERRWKSIKR